MKKSKEIISDKVATVNQILPHTNKWAWDLFIDGAANNWMPTEISMQLLSFAHFSNALNNNNSVLPFLYSGFT